MSVVLIFPPQIEKKNSNQFVSQTTLPPLGIASIAAFLEEHDIPVKIIDASILGVSFSQLIQLLKKINPAIIGLTAQTPVVYRSLKAANMIKAEFPEIPIILGGPHPTVLPQKTLEEAPFIDFIVIGEGEFTTLELVNAIYSNKKFDSIKGIGYRNNGKIQINPPRPYIDDINILPFPARHLLPLYRYKPSPHLYIKEPVTSAIVSRGCPYQCKFCSKAIWGHRLRERSAEKVYEEILLLKDKFRVNEIIFTDDIFTLNKKRIMKLCSMIRKSKLDISWSCLTRVNAIDKALLISMKKSGCHQIAFGVESGNQATLDLIGKRITLKQAEYAHKITRQAGIEIRTYFMLALPGETREMSFQTIKFAKKINPDYAYFYIYTPYPGTKLWGIAEEKGQILNKDWMNFSRWDPNYIPEDRTKEEIKHTFKSAYRMFYLRPKFIMDRLLNFKSFKSIKKNLQLVLEFLKAMVS